MRKIKIDKNVPLPPKRGEARAYPWGDLAIGDSFLARGKQINGLGAARDWAQKRFKRKFAMRSVEGGVRIWRVE